MKLLVADLETEGIESRPNYPPRPVGLSLWPMTGPEAWRKPRYFAWGHADLLGNDSSEREAITHYKSFLRRGYVPIFHNAAFDLAVLEEQCGVAWPKEWHDTMLLSFLQDPREPTFSLKPMAEKHLGEPPEEQNILRDWIQQNVPEAKKKKSTWGAYIARAPVELVRPYANGDSTRTGGLFRKFWRLVNASSQFRQAYDRERELTPILVGMEARGIPVRTQVLQRDLKLYEKQLAKQEAWILDRLRVPKREREEFVFTGDCLADALERTRKVKEWILTDKGNRATNAEDLAEVCLDKQLVKELEVRSQVFTCINTFMRPWLSSGLANDGKFYARFNQVRQDYHDGRKVVGAVTGRMSMSPNLQNVIRADKDPRVPKLRDYIWPGSRDKVLVQRDYSQQELRITAHYEAGPFLRLYLEQPKIDAHNAVKELIRQAVGVDLDRRYVKDLNFGLLYGMGVGKLARKLNLEIGEARKLMKAHLKALPGIKELREQLEEGAKAGDPLWTWGGRRYYCEEPKLIKGRLWSFEYKQLNYLIQGSAADCTKQAMINYSKTDHADEWPLLLQVHDELLLTAPKAKATAAHAALREAMMDVKFKVPMLSDGKTGAISWHQMKKVA